MWFHAGTYPQTPPRNQGNNSLYWHRIHVPHSIVVVILSWAPRYICSTVGQQHRKSTVHSSLAVILAWGKCGGLGSIWQKLNRTILFHNKVTLVLLPWVLLRHCSISSTVGRKEFPRNKAYFADLWFRPLSALFMTIKGKQAETNPNASFGCHKLSESNFGNSERFTKTYHSSLTTQTSRSSRQNCYSPQHVFYPWVQNQKAKNRIITTVVEIQSLLQTELHSWFYIRLW